MANFGFSVGDIITVSTLAWRTYKACKGAGDDFREASSEVLSLHIVIKELGDEVANSKSLVRLEGKAETLQVLLSGCESGLKMISKIVKNCSSLGTDQKKLKDRIKLGLSDLPTAQLKITVHIGALNTFLANLNSAGLVRLIKKLDEAVKDIKIGKGNNSILSLASDTSDVTELDASWERFKIEMLTEGMEKHEIEDKRDLTVAFVSDTLQATPQGSKSRMKSRRRSAEASPQRLSERTSRHLPPIVEETLAKQGSNAGAGAHMLPERHDMRSQQIGSHVSPSTDQLTVDKIITKLRLTWGSEQRPDAEDWHPDRLLSPKTVQQVDARFRLALLNMVNTITSSGLLEKDIDLL